MNGKRDVYSNASQPVARALRSDYSQVEDVTCIALTSHRGTLENKETKVRSENLIVADSNVLRFFERNFVEGNPANALSLPGSVVISVSMANDLFGQLDVLGRVIHLREYEKDLKVTGVMEDDTHRSHFPMDVIVSSTTFSEWQSDKWYGFHTYMYVLLNQENDIATLDAQMPAFFVKYMKKTFDEFNGTARLHFQPLTEIYLSDELAWEPNPHGSKTNILALSMVAILLIVFAVINYVNLATAQAAERATEVSIRKTMGSSRRLLWAQFLSESILLSSSAGVVAIALSWGLLPYFNRLSGVELGTREFFTSLNLGVILLSTIGVGLLAGIFPAFYLSSSHALGALKGKFVVSPMGEILRRVLVTSQYFIAALLISGILLVYDQVTFIKNKDIGFTKENLLNVKIPHDSVVNNHVDVYVNTIKTLPNVLSTSLASIELHKESDSFSPTLKSEDSTEFQMGSDLIWVDADFLPTIGAEIVTGRNFDKRTTDVNVSILINEAAAKKFGWEKNPLGGKLAGFTPTEPLSMDVIGVVKDFNIGVLLVIIANVLAVPATWYLVREWLSNFAYRIDINPVAFVVPFMICLLFTGLSIGYHTGRAALANPVSALKCE
jgi:putative ABC transport system permease protein